MTTPFLTYGNLRVLNLPNAKAMFDEVLVEDCYRRASIPARAIVLDVGGHYGEFGIWCAAAGHSVRIYEPSPLFRICAFNATLNDLDPLIFNVAIANTVGPRPFVFEPAATYTSHLRRLDDGPFSPQSMQVPCLTLRSEITEARRFCPFAIIAVKIDCEGGEREIFEDESWLDQVNWLALEFHNKDGPRYREILGRHGFTLDTNDPNPEAIRATIYAKRD